jgi:hypothetical protein
MITPIKKFDGNALAIELSDSFTEADAQLIEQLFEEKLNQGYSHVNILIQVKDLSILQHMSFKGFLQGELWGIKHFSKIGKCAVVAHSSMMESVVNFENKALHLFNHALEEKYFDVSAMDKALKFISPEE